MGWFKLRTREDADGIRMNYRILILIVMQLTALGAYANPAGDSLPADAGSQIIRLPVKFLGFDGKELRPEMRPFHLSLGLVLVPGAFHGGSASYLEMPYLGGQTSIKLDLGHFAEKFGSKAAPEAETESPEFEVTPKETRFAKLLVGLWFKTTKNIKIKTGFYDADTRDSLTLVYFDRPCHVSGIDTGTYAVQPDSPPRMDIEVDAPGWVWIETKKTDPSSYVNVRAPSPHPVLLIAPAQGDLYRNYQEGTN